MYLLSYQHHKRKRNTMQHMLGEAKPKGVYNASASTSLPFHSNA